MFSKRKHQKYSKKSPKNLQKKADLNYRGKFWKFYKTKQKLSNLSKMTPLNAYKRKMKILEVSKEKLQKISREKQKSFRRRYQIVTKEKSKNYRGKTVRIFGKVTRSFQRNPQNFSTENILWKISAVLEGKLKKISKQHAQKLLRKFPKACNKKLFKFYTNKLQRFTKKNFRSY